MPALGVHNLFLNLVTNADNLTANFDRGISFNRAAGSAAVFAPMERTSQARSLDGIAFRVQLAHHRILIVPNVAKRGRLTFQGGVIRRIRNDDLLQVETTRNIAAVMSPGFAD